MAMKQATGVPTGNHGLFHRFGIEAITMQGVALKSRKRFEVDFHTVGRIMEGIFRSLNNLLERFHQSFFFYLLPSSSRYVSIGMYMPAFGFLGGALVITALGLWFDCTAEEQRAQGESDRKNENNKKNETKKKEKKAVAADDDDETTTDPPEPSLPVVIPSSLISVIPAFILSHLLGLLLLFLPRPISAVGARFKLETDDALTLGLLAFILYSLVLPRYLRQAITVTEDNWKVLKCLTMLELAAFAFTTSLGNFSLAYLVTLVYVPFALLVSPSGASTPKWLARILLSLLAHPFMMLAVACSMDTAISFGKDKPILELLGMCADATKRAVTYSLTDAMIYGNSNYAMAAVVLTPCWYLLWCLNFTTGNKADELKKIQ